MDDRRVPGTLRFRDPVERNEVRIRSARLLVQIAAHRREAVAARWPLTLPGCCQVNTAGAVPTRRVGVHVGCGCCYPCDVAIKA